MPRLDRISRLDRIPLWLLAAAAGFMALAPFVPEPHLWRDLRWLVAGELTRPRDLFDLAWHGALPALLVVRLVRDRRRKAESRKAERREAERREAERREAEGR